MISSLRNFLTTPSYPRTALSISELQLAIVSLKKQRGDFEPTRLAMLPLPAGLITPDFDERNISDEGVLAEELERLIDDSGIRRMRSLAVALPEGSARSLIVSIESAPSNPEEFSQVLGWKVERSLGCKTSDVRLMHRRLRGRNGANWLVTVIHNTVIDQYERVFARLRWNVGLCIPQHLAEAQWLLRSDVREDQMMVSLNTRGFVAVVVRDREPILVREVICTESERQDEFHRLMTFYRDRLQADHSASMPNRLLVIGSSEEQQAFRRTLAGALETAVTPLDPAALGLRLPARAPFPAFAAAAGLSTFAFA